MSDLKQRPYRGVNKEDRISQRRDKLVESAVQLFGELGFANTSIKALCVNAGLTERSFYESFGVKEDLLQAAYLHARTQILGAMGSAAATAAPTPVARHRAVASEYFRQLHIDANRARLVLFELEGVSESCDDVVRQVLLESCDLILEVINAGQPRTLGKGLDARLLALGHIGAGYQLAKSWVRSDFELPEETMVRNTHAMFTGMLTLWEEAK